MLTSALVWHLLCLQLLLQWLGCLLLLECRLCANLVGAEGLLCVGELDRQRLQGRKIRASTGTGKQKGTIATAHAGITHVDFLFQFTLTILALVTAL